MTSQIIVINQGGISIASDTLTTHQQGHGEIKTIPSNSKIHHLKNEHLVAVLHCGRVFLGNVQWETLVREWSLTIENRAEKLEHYVNSFVEWVSRNENLFHLPEKEMVRTVICDELTEIFGFEDGPLVTALVGKSKNDGSISDDAFSEKICSALEEWMKYKFQGEHYEDLSPEIVMDLVQNEEVGLLDEFMEHASTYGAFEFDSKVQECLKKFATELVIRFVPTDSCMFLNFTGFGTEEIFGQRVELAIRSFYRGKLRFAAQSFGSHLPEEYPQCHPLAQQDAIESFLRGVDDGARYMLQNIALQAFNGISTLTDEQQDKFKSVFWEQSGALFRKNFAEPLLSTLSTLGLDAMTRFAEMMIRFQCLRAASVAGEATVGGFVESLSISRDGGIDWHQRMSLETHSLEHASHVFA